jgi:hypothetical protein
MSTAALLTGRPVAALTTVPSTLACAKARAAATASVSAIFTSTSILPYYGFSLLTLNRCGNLLPLRPSKSSGCSGGRRKADQICSTIEAGATCRTRTFRGLRSDLDATSGRTLEKLKAAKEAARFHEAFEEMFPPDLPDESTRAPNRPGGDRRPSRHGQQSRSMCVVCPDGQPLHILTGTNLLGRVRGVKCGHVYIAHHCTFD